MLYVERNQTGKIIAVRRDADRPGMEFKSSVDVEILEFLGYGEKDDSVYQILSAMDAGVVRVLEDLVDLLVRKNIIMFTEFPEEAQRKLSIRRQIRENIGKESIIVEDIV
jgi:hypothetical protein